jgi:hypothetical protein
VRVCIGGRQHGIFLFGGSSGLQPRFECHFTITGLGERLGGRLEMHLRGQMVRFPFEHAGLQSFLALLELFTSLLVFCLAHADVPHATGGHVHIVSK